MLRLKHLLLGATVVLGAAGCAHQPTLPDNATSCPPTSSDPPVPGGYAAGAGALH